ncbi:protein FAR1-RELATED SEQUENCE 3-like [Arachis stenosperma]|uniref:protein FAR1-RELATED SEQUENCE 3-like n=1 Tax=Arachis stenosperma TaxID=217475 RepID=UPI0025AD78F0|nr:protein FAR1-RELATED SEQUENCE 3-like [Arachis stenosperma]
MELFASKVYTWAVFKEVKKQIKGVATLLFWGRDSISTTCVYRFSRMEKPDKTHKVLYDSNEEKIKCECSMWNNEGIPCSRIFCIMKYEGLERIPHDLVLSRWCKDAKDCISKPLEVAKGHHGRLLRHGALCGATSLVAKLGSEDAADFVIARDGLANLAKALQRRVYDRVGSQLGLLSQDGIKDPEVSKTKGAPKKGKEPEPGSQGEDRSKRRCCTDCGAP